MPVIVGTGPGEYPPTLNYVVNGDPADDNTFNKPSVSLDARTEALRNFVDNVDLQTAYDGGNVITESGSTVTFFAPGFSTQAMQIIVNGATTHQGHVVVLQDPANDGEAFRGLTSGAGAVARLQVLGTGKHLALENPQGEVIGVSAPLLGVTNYDLVLPVDVGNPGEALVTDGAGNLSWATVSTSMQDAYDGGPTWSGSASMDFNKTGTGNALTIDNDGTQGNSLRIEHGSGIAQDAIFVLNNSDGSSFSVSGGSATEPAIDLANLGTGGGIRTEGAGRTLFSPDKTAASSDSDDLIIGTGDVTGATSNSGDLTLQTGTATGTRGKIKLVDGSEGTPGNVWTEGAVPGEGVWAPAGGGGDLQDAFDADPTIVIPNASGDRLILTDNDTTASGAAFQIINNTNGNSLEITNTGFNGRSLRINGGAVQSALEVASHTGNQAAVAITHTGTSRALLVSHAPSGGGQPAAYIVAGANSGSNLQLFSTGTGPYINVLSAGSQSLLQVDKGGFTFNLKTPTFTESWDLTVPPDSGDPGDVLTTDGAGATAWAPGVLTAQITLSPAQVQALDTTPIDIVAAPGAGKYHSLLRVECLVDFQSIAYTGSTNIRVNVNTNGSVTFGNILGATGIRNDLEPFTDDHTIVTNSSMSVDSSAAPADGDSPVKVKVWYTVETALT